MGSSFGNGPIRNHLIQYCIGNGLDIGFGGYPISPTAITLDKPDCVHKGNLSGDAGNLHWFRDGVLDYVFSAHCLEDAEDTVAWLREWWRVLRPGGHLVLFLPDQVAYERHCRTAGVEPNGAHKHHDFSLEYVKKCLHKSQIPQTSILYEKWPINEDAYSFEIVLRKDHRHL